MYLIFRKYEQRKPSICGKLPLVMTYHSVNKREGYLAFSWYSDSAWSGCSERLLIANRTMRLSCSSDKCVTLWSRVSFGLLSFLPFFLPFVPPASLPPPLLMSLPSPFPSSSPFLLLIYYLSIYLSLYLSIIYQSCLSFSFWKSTPLAW